MQPSTAPPRSKIGYLGGGDHLIGYVPPEQDITNAGSTDLYHLRTRDQDDWVRLQIPRNYLRLPRKHRFGDYDVLLNLITDPDQNPKTLELLTKVLRDYKGRLINPPQAVLKTTRERVALTLQGVDGLVVPRVARFVGTERAARAAIAKTGLPFPAILRPTGTHSGRIVGVVDTIEAVIAQIEPGQSYFLTEFVDTRGPDGFYRKMRIFFIGDTPVMRHLLISDRWNIHAADRQRIMAGRAALVMQERVYVEPGIVSLPPSARRTLDQMKQRMKLDFFGADLGFGREGTLVLFEANPTMNFFPLSDDPQFSYLAAARDRAAEAFGRLLHPDGTTEANA
jgi:glutathione synthase/RimK-type ligase-like ATP-grasp enzyme